jgi:alpha-mannosidase
MLTDLAVILPCHSLDDFPTHGRGDEAEGLLAAWSALWHPALLAAVGKTPLWHQASEPPPSAVGKLMVLPEAARSHLSEGYLTDVRQQGAVVIENMASRDQIAAAAIAAITTENPGAGSSQDANQLLADDFLALGFCYLQSELLTRRMRYSSHLDEGKFERAALAAARAWQSGNEVEVKLQLGIAFGALLQARSQYYPVDAYLIDVILIASTTIGRALRNELAGSTPRNVLISAEALELMAKSAPDSLTALRAAIESGKVGLIGGDFEEAEPPLLPHESILAELQAAAPIYERHLGRKPTIYGRRRFGLTPVLPQILHQSGFAGAWHVALDDGHFPQADRSKTRWEGVDGTSIDALVCLPFDAARAESFLKLPEELGNTMDNDFVATLMFARWPGGGSAFHHDLLRMAAYAPVLGKFVTVEEYFRETAESSIKSKFSPDQYRTPYLQQAVVNGAADPISKHVRNLSRQLQQEVESAVATMTAALTGKPTESKPTADDFAAALPRSNNPQELGVLIVNPLNFTRMVGLELPGNNSVEQLKMVAEVPPLGFAWIAAAEKPNEPARNRGRPIAGENVLLNEFCEVTISPTSGGIQSIYDLRTHGNRLSQQIAIRLPRASGSSTDRAADPDESPYTTMVADSVQIESSESVLGKIKSRGRLVDPAGRELARFTQNASLWQSSRVIGIEITIDNIAADFERDPWNSYMACRFALPDMEMELRRSVHGCSFPSDAKRLEAPQFVEIVSGRLRTAILTGGLPYHRRLGMRMLDSILLVRGETAKAFRLGIGIDVPHVWRAARELLLPPMTVSQQASPPISGDVGWLFHIDAPNVAATHWSPLAEAGRVIGFRVRLLETEGRSGRIRVRSFGPPVAAVQTNVSGEAQTTLSVHGDAIELEMVAYDWTQIEARW